MSVGADADGNGVTETPLSLYAYNSLAQVTGISRGNAAWSAGVTRIGLAWEADGDLDALTHTFASEVAAFDYGYDRSAKLVSEAKPSAYAYAPSQAQTISYSLGAAGNGSAETPLSVYTQGELPYSLARQVASRDNQRDENHVGSLKLGLGSAGCRSILDLA